MKVTDTASIKRREFVALSSKGMAAASLLLIPGALACAPSPAGTAALTVQQVIDIILKEIPGAPFSDTVDTIKSGKGDMPVTGIVTTMFATVDVIRKAIALKANFIIAHEPTFYNHADQTDWLKGSSVYEAKRKLLDENSIVVWRFHDYIHSHRPDGVMMGVLTALGWEKYYNAASPNMVNIPSATLQDIIALSKTKLGIEKVRAIGDPTQACVRIALLPGASGGKRHIGVLMKENPDLLICGEIQEWETSEYIRDARSLGQKTALLVLGHAVSEEPGMEWLVPWLQPKVGALKVTHLVSGNPLSFY